MFRATYTSETLPLLLRYVAGLGQTGLLHCQSPEMVVTVLSLTGQQVISCTTLPPQLEGLDAVQALLRQPEGTCHFEESWAAQEAPLPLRAASLLMLDMEDLLIKVQAVSPALDLTHIGPHSVPDLLVAAPPAVLEGGPEFASAEFYGRLWALIDGQRTVQALAHTLGHSLDEVRLILAQLEQQGSLRLGTGPLVSAEGMGQFVQGLTAVVGPVAKLLMRDALKAIGVAQEAVPVGLLPELKTEVLRGCPVSRHPQIEALFLSLARLHPAQPPSRPPAVQPFSSQELTHQLTHLLGPIARELVHESLQQVQGSASPQTLDTAQIPNFLDALQALLPPARRGEAVLLLQSFRR